MLFGPEEQSREVVKTGRERGNKHSAWTFHNRKVNTTHGGRRLDKLQNSADWEAREKLLLPWQSPLLGMSLVGCAVAPAAAMA